MALSATGYRFFSMDSDERYTGVVVRPFSDVDSALDYARRLLVSAVSVEVWSGEEFVERVSDVSA